MIEVYISNCLLLHALFTNINHLLRIEVEKKKKRHSIEMPLFILFTITRLDARDFVDASLMSSSCERSIEEGFYHLRSLLRRNHSSR